MAGHSVLGAICGYGGQLHLDGDMASAIGGEHISSEPIADGLKLGDPADRPERFGEAALQFKMPGGLTNMGAIGR